MKGVKFEISQDQIEEVMSEFEAETGKPAHEMPSVEFADRMMKKIEATATVVTSTKGNTP